MTMVLQSHPWNPHAVADRNTPADTIILQELLQAQHLTTKAPLSALNLFVWRDRNGILHAERGSRTSKRAEQTGSDLPFNART